MNKSWNVDINIIWQGKGAEEVGIDSKSGEVKVKIDKNYFRPTEVDLLIGDSSKAEKILKWKPVIQLEEIIEEMVRIALHNESHPKTDFLLADFWWVFLI